MITKEALIDYFSREEEATAYRYDSESGNLINNNTGEILCSIDDYLDIYKKRNGMSFDCIYDDHVGLYSVLRCTKCGTVVKFSYDTSDHEYDFTCPVCTNYKTNYQFWSREQIETNQNLQEMIRHFKKLAQDDQVQEERIKKRKGKQDWQLAVARKFIRTKNSYWSAELKVNNITNPWPLSGLRLRFDRWKKLEPSDQFFTWKDKVVVPLSPNAFYYQMIYPHTKRYREKHEKLNK